MHLDAVTEGTGTLHVQGTAFTGLPVVLIGHSERLAWGLTTIEIDNTDYYQETLTADGHAVLFEGNEVPLVEQTVTFQVAGGSPVDVDLAWVPHHGPLLAQSGQSGISARWVGHSAPPDVDGLFALMRYRRLRTWGRIDLLFDDELPEDITPIRLN